MDAPATYAVVMAGGKGERFWPMSRASRPKQLLSLLGGRTLLGETVVRLGGVIPAERILVVTRAADVPAIQELLPELPPGNIVGEPVGRDTAPCVALAAGLVAARAGDDQAVMVLLPADHVIHDADALCRSLADCATMAAAGHLVTIGIPPTGPDTAYGYLHCGDPVPGVGQTRFFRSLGFREKPDADTAQALLATGAYRWNSGMFAWTVAAIHAEFARQAPSLADAVCEFRAAALAGTLGEVLATRYPELPKVSIDYAVMEHARDVVVAEAAFDWDDVGIWTALRNHFPADADGNVALGRHVGVDTQNCLVVGRDDHLVATVGVQDLVVVHTPDATLVCDARSGQRLKALLAAIAARPELARHL
jgi:mannose-1-phosphate guanylyltransferase